MIVFLTLNRLRKIEDFVLSRPRDGVRWTRRQELLQGGQWGSSDGLKNILDTNQKIANKK